MDAALLYPELCFKAALKARSGRIIRAAKDFCCFSSLKNKLSRCKNISSIDVK